MRSCSLILDYFESDLLIGWEEDSSVHDAECSFAENLVQLVELFDAFILHFLLNLRIEIVENSIEDFLLEIILSHELGCEPKVLHVGGLILIGVSLEPAVVLFSIVSLALGGSAR